MRITFVRHGQSTANAGLPSHNPDDIQLTDLGRQQARELAASWTTAPSRIVVSPFLRTQQTAQPTRDRFPNVPVETWPIQEFTYLEPSRWLGSTPADRRPAVRAYWASNDPSFCDGPGAESLLDLLARADAALTRIEILAGILPDLLLFSHSQFMHAVAIQALERQASAEEKMRWISNGGSGSRFANCQLLQLALLENRWRAILEPDPASGR